MMDMKVSALYVNSPGNELKWSILEADRLAEFLKYGTDTTFITSLDLREESICGGGRGRRFTVYIRELTGTEITGRSSEVTVCKRSTVFTQWLRANSPQERWISPALVYILAQST